MHIAFLGTEHPARAQTERMVRAVYRAVYGARVDAFPPLMVAALDGRGRALCAAGLRTASSGFFSECYLDDPAEVSISRVAHTPVARNDVLEVTTLAGVEACLTLKLAEFVIEQQPFGAMRWGLFTGATALLRALRHAGFAPLELAVAMPERIADASQWGTYYRRSPRVCAIPLCGVASAERSPAALSMAQQQVAAVA
jgi:hypothetical protein